MDYYSIISFEGPGLDLGGPFYIQEYRKSALRYWKYLGEPVNGHSDDYIYIDIMQKRVFFQPDPIKVTLGDDEGVTASRFSYPNDFALARSPPIAFIENAIEAVVFRDPRPYPNGWNLPIGD